MKFVEITQKLFGNFLRKKSTTSSTCDISLDQFFERFRNLATSDDQNGDEEVEDYLRAFDNNNEGQNVGGPTFESLDEQISHEEIKRCIKQLSRNKSPVKDNLLNKYFMESIDLLIEPLGILFNDILDSGYFPSQWTEGIIIPLHKKGSHDDPKNYRGITLISCLGKLFTSIINQRLINWSTANEISTDAQFGFKSGHSTKDAIFILQNLIQKRLNNKKRLYCAFIDLQRAFDSVYRNALWYKLIKYGVDGKLFKLLRSMYSAVKSCVRHLNTLSDFFSLDIGLFQGEIMSPILFSFFLNDIEQNLQELIFDGITLDQITIYLLLFADDAILISDTKEGLQRSLNQFEAYCKKWKLTVIIGKTKVMICKKGGRAPDEHFTLNGEKLELVSEFKYLGYVISNGGSVQKAINLLADKAVRSMGMLLSTIKRIEVPFKMLMQLFDTYVKSILNYGCEIWGFSSAEKCERVHRKFLKRVLGVKMSTNTMALYGDTGRFPIFVDRYVRIVKYWLKIVKSDYANCIVKSVYTDLFNDVINNENTINWVSQVRGLLQRSGFHDVWTYPDSVDDSKFIPVFKQRVRDQYLTVWNAKVLVSSSLEFYKEICPTICTATYLHKIVNIRYRRALSKIRLASYDLQIELGRHRGIERSERKCVVCNRNEIEDVFHLILICPKYAHIRNQHLKRYYHQRPSMFKLVQLFNDDSLLNLKK